MYVVVPILDLILGKDPVNPEANDESQLNNDPFYRYLAISAFPLYLICLFSTAYLFINWTELSVFGQQLYKYKLRRLKTLV